MTTQLDPKSLTDKQIDRRVGAIYRYFDRYAEGDPFGWDWPTMRVVFPEAVDECHSLKMEARRRMWAGTWTLEQPEYRVFWYKWPDNGDQFVEVTDELWADATVRIAGLGYVDIGHEYVTPANRLEIIARLERQMGALPADNVAGRLKFEKALRALR